jgi:hypothetical protein
MAVGVRGRTTVGRHRRRHLVLRPVMPVVMVRAARGVRSGGATGGEAVGMVVVVTPVVHVLVVPMRRPLGARGGGAVSVRVLMAVVVMMMRPLEVVGLREGPTGMRPGGEAVGRPRGATHVTRHAAPVRRRRRRRAADDGHVGWQ